MDEVKQGDIFIVYPNSNIESEYQSNYRLVLVLTNYTMNESNIIVVVAPITNKKYLKSSKNCIKLLNSLNGKYTVMLDAFCTMNINKLNRKVGTITLEDMSIINNVFKSIFMTA